nr:aminopeptidase N-like [Onthophagus taurus]
MKIRARTRIISLHQSNLNFTKENITVVLTKPEIKSLTIKRVDYTPSSDLYKITLTKKLQENDLIDITIDYLGGFGENQGFYKSKYIDEYGTERILGLTQFQPIYARSVFPCIDQPDMKALFTINIIRSSTYSSISNTPLESSKKIGGDLYQDTFKPTPSRLPPHLIGFVISQLKICYMEKIDYVALPDKFFQPGIVDNFGLVFLNEELMFYNDQLNSPLQKQSTLLAITHELVNQWFGHSVIANWWDNIWLNKAIDTFLEYYFANEVDPDMYLMNQFVNRVHQKGLELDSDINTKSLSSPIGSFNEIEKLSHSLTHYKGAALMRMISNFITNDVFNCALHMHMKNNYYWGATYHNFLSSIENCVNKLSNYKKRSLGFDENKVLLQTVMNRWFFNVGYPVVTVERDEDNNVILSQDRFLSNIPISKDETLWPIPINFATFDKLSFTETKPQFWLTSRIEKLVFNNVNVNLSQSIILNKQSTGFYRVNYDEKNWNDIIGLFKSLKEDVERIDVLNRAQFIDDSFNLARSGRLNYTIPFRLALYLQNETKSIPFTSFFNVIGPIDKLMGNCENYNNFGSYIKAVLKKPYRRLKELNLKAHTVQFTFDNVIYWLGRVMGRECITDAHNLFMNTNITNIPPYQQRQIYCGAMRKPIRLSFKIEKLYSILDNENIDKQQKERALEGLACSLRGNFLWELLTQTINEENEYISHHKEDVFYTVLSSSNIGLNVVVKFIVENFNIIKATFGKSVGKLLENIALNNANRNHALLLSRIDDDEYYEDVVKAINTITENEKFYNEKLRVHCQRFLELYPRSSSFVCYISFEGMIIIVMFVFMIS